MMLLTMTQIELVKKVLSEVRKLRQEVRILLPHEELKGYAHPQRIKHSYLRALRQYPPAV